MNKPESPNNANLATFDFDGLPIRSQVDEHGEPWFVAADVCAALDIQNVSQAVENLDDDERSDISTTYTSSKGVGVLYPPLEDTRPC